MTIKENIEIVLEKANASGNIDIYNNVLKNVIAWIEDQTKIYNWQELRKSYSTQLIEGQSNILLPDDYNKILNAYCVYQNMTYPIEVNDIDDREFIIFKSQRGLPKYVSVFENKLYFSPIPDRSLNFTMNYFSKYQNLDENSSVFFSDKIIQQVAYIYVLQYDRLDSTTEEVKLEKMLIEHKRVSPDLDGSGRIQLSKYAYPRRRYFRFRL
jgi:hypothetical protein